MAKKEGSDDNVRTILNTIFIFKAVQYAQSGDTILIHAGTYRERIDPIRSNVTFLAAPHETVIIKGSEIINTWVKKNNTQWTVTLPNTFFKDYNPYADLINGDWYFPKKNLHTGEVFLNGKPLEEYVNWTCLVNGTQTNITADFGNKNPNKETVEITVRTTCFYPSKPGINNITVKGFHFSQGATQWAAPTAEQIGIIGTNWSKGWIIEDNIISDSKCVGITLGKDRASGQNPWSKDMSKDGSVIYNEMIRRVITSGWNKQNIGSHLVRHNKIYNCGAAGICGSFGAAYSQIVDNDIHDVYTNRNFYGAEMAGLKFHGAVDMIISGNKVNNCFIGLWLDWMAQGTTVTNNTFTNNDYVDFFPEVNHGPYIVTKNKFLSAFSLKDWSEGGDYRYNYFAGLLSRAPQDRATPIFTPHTTELIAVEPIRGGNNRFIDNTFAGPPQKIPLRPKMHAHDQEDNLLGYGLAIYADAAQPVSDRHNKYLGQAQPLKSQVSN